MTERHTRQGAARGQRHGTLDRDLNGDPGGRFAATSHSAMAEKVDLRRAPPDELTRRLGPPIGGLGGCECPNLGRHA